MVPPISRPQVAIAIWMVLCGVQLDCCMSGSDMRCYATGPASSSGTQALIQGLDLQLLHFDRKALAS